MSIIEKGKSGTGEAPADGRRVAANTSRTRSAKEGDSPPEKKPSGGNRRGLEQLRRLVSQIFGDLNREFFQESPLPTPEFRLEIMRQKVVARFQAASEANGTGPSILLNLRQAGGPMTTLCANILHEMVHFWQALHGVPPGSHLHNAEFSEKASACGIACGRKASQSVVRMYERFREYVATRLHIWESLRPSEPPVPRKPVTKMKKWSCACTNVRAAGPLDAKCCRCGAAFTMQPCSY